MKIPESTWSRKFGLSVKKMNSREISERYRLIADYHTHTRYSKGLLVYYHGKGIVCNDNLLYIFLSSLGLHLFTKLDRAGSHSNVSGIIH